MVSVLGAFAVGVAIGIVCAVPVCIILFACCNIAGLCSDAERRQ